MSDPLEVIKAEGEEGDAVKNEPLEEGPSRDPRGDLEEAPNPNPKRDLGEQEDKDPLDTSSVPPPR